LENSFLGREKKLWMSGERTGGDSKEITSSAAGKQPYIGGWVEGWVNGWWVGGEGGLSVGRIGGKGGRVKEVAVIEVPLPLFPLL